ncbi:MAG: cupin domain-containing protein, partial [Ilumatobacteraceae bacterium]
IWLHHDGGPLRLSIADEGGRVERHLLGRDVAAGQRPQVIVPAGRWQSAEPSDEWTLVSCVVAPAFTFDGFELAPDGWEPGRRTTGDEPS